MRLRRRPPPPAEPTPEPTARPVDLGCITHVCPCGSLLWSVMVIFDDYEVAAYMLDMTCVGCGNKAIAPTLVDRPDEGFVTC